MRPQTTAVLLAGTLVIGACSGGDDVDTATPESPPASITAPGDAATDTTSPDDEPDDAATTTAPTAAPTTAPADEPSAPPTTLPRPIVDGLVEVDADGNIISDEVPALGPISYDEVVDFGIEAGIWDERDGLTRVLGWVLGIVPGDQVPGVSEIVYPDLGDVLQRANALALSGDFTEDELATLRSYYQFFAPPASARDAVGAAPTGFARPQGFAAAPAQSSDGCTTIDPNMYDPDAVFASCYDMLSRTSRGVQLRVFVPRSFQDDPQALNLGPTALAALETSVFAYEGLGELGDMDLVLTDAQIAESDGLAGVATVTAYWGTVTTEGCPITIFGNAWAESPEVFEQVVAHEAWHCVQHYDGFPMAVPSGTAWYREGGAHFFSNVAFPDNNYEHRVMGAFDRRSVDRPIHALSYDTWMFWQYLSNLRGERYVADLQRSMMNAGGNGAGQLDDLDEEFHNFVVEFAAGTLKDQNGGALRQATNYISNLRDVTKEDEGRKVEMKKSKQYVAARYRLEYDKELRVFQSDQSATGGRFSSAEWPERSTLDSWKAVAPEVRTECTEKSRYAFVGTSTEADQTFVVQIDKIEEAACDPCVLGTWSLQLDTFQSMLENAMAAQGGGLPPGISWEFGGAYYIQFVDEEVVREQRDGLTIGFAMEGVGGFTTTIDSFATGTYQADGETITVQDLVEAYARVSTNVPLGGTFDFPSAIDQASGEYRCDDETLTIEIAGFDPIVWDRVDKILEPDEGDSTATDAQP